MKFTLGHKDGAPVQVDLTAMGGVRLIGGGAEQAERALLLQAVSDAKQGLHQVVTVKADLCRLLGEDGGHRIADADLPCVHVASTVADALNHLGGEIVGRSATVEETGGDTGGSARVVPVLCLLDPGRQATRMKAELRLGADRAIGGVILGDWQHGTTLAVDSAGVIVDCTGQADEGLVGTQMRLIDTPSGQERVAEIAAQAEGTRVEGTGLDIAPLPRIRAELAVVPPGMIRLLGGYAVEGTAGQVGGRAMDVWALLGLLAENRNTLLTRGVAQDKIWPDASPSPDRFPTLLRDTRAKLCDALGRHSNPGRRVIQNVASNGYQINPELFTCDVWQLRDLLADAAIAEGPEKAAALSAAADLYTGPYLLDLQHPWARTAARAVTRQVVGALTQLATLVTTPQRAVVYLERATDIDTAAEHLYRLRMQMYADLGRAPAVHHCYDQLNDELKVQGRKPEVSTVQLYQRLAAEG